MRHLLVIFAIVAATSGCGAGTEHAVDNGGDPPSGQAAPENAETDSSAPNISAADVTSPESGMTSSSPKSTVITLTDRAARALLNTAERHRLQGIYYVRVVVQRKAAADYRCDLNITRKFDPAADVLMETKGLRIVIDRTSVPYVRGGIVDFGTHGQGFQFRKPKESRNPAASALASKTLAPTLAPNDSGASRMKGISPGPYSNIHHDDYVGPQACAKCHDDQYQLWRTHPHSKMNRDASAETVLGNFSGNRLQYGNDDTVSFETKDGVFQMAVFRNDTFVRRYRVTRTVGSRIFQMYIGTQSEGPEPADDPIYTEERKLPFAFWIDRQQWFPESYDEPVSPAEYNEFGEITDVYAVHTRNLRPCWDENCLWCHNTYPYEARLQYHATGFPHDHLSLTRVRRPVPRGRTPGKRSLPARELVTMGISCESCHFGGREHVVQQREIRFLPCSDDLQFPHATRDLMANARQSPYVINSICSQCHAVRQPRYPSSASTWNSGEAADLLAGSCAGTIKCTDCHNPHQPGPKGGGGPDNPAHIEACVRCHEKYREAAAASAHARHPATSDISCLDCHMPRIVHGLQTVVRSHRISSPTETGMLSRGAPNACNMCHLNRSIQWTLDELETGWGRRIEPRESWKTWYGGTWDEPVGRVWLRHPAPMARQVAADAYSRSPLGESALVDVLPLLNDRDPPTRMFGLFAVERILGRRIDVEEYSPWASPATRRERLQALNARVVRAVGAGE